MGRREKVGRDQVLAAAREAFVARGYEGTTLADIAARVGVSPAALLRHAPTKQTLFTAAMGATPGPEMLPLAFLEDVPGDASPEDVLRQVAYAFVPFIQAKLSENLSTWVHFRTLSGGGKLPLPFDPEVRPTPPQANLKLLEAWLRRARRAGRVSVADPRAAAFAFGASMHSFVLMQQVIRALEEPLTLEDYLDTVLTIWKRGAIVPAATVRGRRRTPRPKTTRTSDRNRKRTRSK
jgi:AcrR family transcriptional regulator